MGLILFCTSDRRSSAKKAHDVIGLLSLWSYGVVLQAILSRRRLGPCVAGWLRFSSRETMASACRFVHISLWSRGYRRSVGCV